MWPSLHPLRPEHNASDAHRSTSAGIGIYSQQQNLAAQGFTVNPTLALHSQQQTFPAQGFTIGPTVAAPLFPSGREGASTEAASAAFNYQINAQRNTPAPAEPYVQAAVRPIAPREGPMPMQIEMFRLRQELEGLREEVQRVKASHEETARELVRLSDSITASTRVVAGTEQGSVFDPQHSRRAVLFLAPSLLTLLKSKKEGFSRPVKHGKQAGTIQSLKVSSKPVECILLEFMALASRLEADTSVRCHGIPSFYEIRFADPCTVSDLEIRFDTFSGLCHALNIPVSDRVNAMYKEKMSDTSQLEAVRVLGFAETIERTNTTKLFLGVSPAPSVPTDTYYLYHDSATWDADDWDRGLSLQQTDCTTMLASPTSNSTYFSISWKRVPTRAGCFGAQYVPGTVRGKLSVSLPAIIVRGAQLTSTASLTLSIEERSQSVLNDICARK